MQTNHYIRMYQHKNRQYRLIDGQLFIPKQNHVETVGPLSQTYHLNDNQCRELVDGLGGMWVQWTGGFERYAEGAEWYAVISRRHSDLDHIESGNTRSKLRRGLKNCEVKKVDAAEIACNGYETYCAALRSYGGTTAEIPSPAEFERRVLSDAPFSDIRHQWAVYRDGKMIAFAQNLIYDKTEVDYTLIKLHPDYLKYYPAYALIYTMNEYYLEQQGFEYVSDGARSILHETGIQDFLIQKFGFEKAFMNLHVYFRPPLGLMLRVARPFRKWLSKVNPKLAAVMELDRVAVNR